MVGLGRIEDMVLDSSLPIPTQDAPKGSGATQVPPRSASRPTAGAAIEGSLGGVVVVAARPMASKRAWAARCCVGSEQQVGG